MQLTLTGKHIPTITIKAEHQLEFDLLAILAGRLDLKPLGDGTFLRQLTLLGRENLEGDPVVKLSKAEQTLTFTIPSGSCWNRDYMETYHPGVAE